jgi:T5orf172 domain
MSDLQDRVSSDVNDTGTSETIDTPVTQRRSRGVRGHVYFIRVGDYIKIGWSTRPMNRLRQFQTSHPDELDIMGTIKGQRSLEGKIHKRFSKTRVRGEWFEVDGPLLDYIDKYTIERKPFYEPKLSPEARTMIVKLTRLRNAHDAESPMGHTCSNLMEQITEMADYVRPAWAVDDRQTLPGLIKWQMDRLAALKAESN